MPTPAYTNLDSNKPAGSDSPTTYSTDNLNNVRALRDMVITGRAAGFVQTRTQGTGPDVARPEYITWLNSSLQVGFRMKSTWGGTGNCQQTSVEWEWTNDNGSSWTTLGTAQANTFDANDNITATTNSGGFVALVMEMWTKLLRYVGAIKVDASNNNVGIGTTPTTKLHVKAATNVNIKTTDNSGAALIIATNDAGSASVPLELYGSTVKLISSGTTALTADSSGNVGIGTSSPQAKLDVAAGSGGTPTYVGYVRIGPAGAQSLNTASGLEFLASTFSSGYGWRVTGNDLGGGSTPFVIESRSNSATWTERMRIDSSGNVGIGASAPGATGYTSFLALGNNNAGIGNAGTNKIGIVTNNVERILVDNAGNVGIGTSSPGTRLEVYGDSGPLLRMSTSVTGTGSGNGLHFGIDGGGAAFIVQNENAAMVFQTNATERMRITEDGRLYGTALHNNAGSVTGTTNQYIASGTMANGNATAVTNVSGTPTYQTMTWMRVGNVVTVAGTVTAAATTANTACSIRFPPPIASGFTAIEDCAGSGTWTTGDNGEPVRVLADEIKDEISVRWVPTSTTNTVMPIHFTYLIK